MIGKLQAIYQIPDKRGFNIKSAAEYLDIHPQTLRNLSDTGEIKCRRFGRRRLFLLEDLDSWLAKQEEWVSNGHN